MNIPIYCPMSSSFSSPKSSYMSPMSEYHSICYVQKIGNWSPQISNSPSHNISYDVLSMSNLIQHYIQIIYLVVFDLLYLFYVLIHSFSTFLISSISKTSKKISASLSNYMFLSLLSILPMSKIHMEFRSYNSLVLFCLS